MYKLQLLILIVFSLNLYSSDLSEFMNRFESNVVCNLPVVNAIPDVHDRCSNEGFKMSDLIGLFKGRFFMRTFTGCGLNTYQMKRGVEYIKAIEGSQNYDVALTGDSLTHYGGSEALWNAYYGFRFRTKNLGAAGATSTAWVDHLRTCETKIDTQGLLGSVPGMDKADYVDSAGNTVSNSTTSRLELPPNVTFMIGGNDFHVFKGILKPLWWAVPFRHNSVLNNIEKVITIHHKGNNGCGDDIWHDSNGNGKVDDGEITQVVPKTKQASVGKESDCNNMQDGAPDNYKARGRGRLMLSLGNLPAVSVNPAVVPGAKEAYQRMGLWEKPNDDMWTEENKGRSKEDDNPLLYAAHLLGESSIDALISLFASTAMYTNKVNCGTYNPFAKCEDNGWASRQMFRLQFKTHAMTVKRGGVPFLHLYSRFRAEGVLGDGCWWCADPHLWMGKKYGFLDVTYSFQDGIHINHPFGYAKLASLVGAFMDSINFGKVPRRDTVVPPGQEQYNGPGCDDLCLIALCYFFKICK